jgi:dUTPase
MYLWKPHIQHHRKLDNLWTGFEITKGDRIGNVSVTKVQDAVGQVVNSDKAGK